LNIKQGAIYRIDLGKPEGSEPVYRHPHVVVQNNVFNQSNINTVNVCALTSNLKRAAVPGNVLLKKGEAGLKKDSVVNISQVVTMNKSDLVEQIGTLPPARVRQIVAGLKLLIEPKDI
jgi:mRNA interferase MazF